MSRNFRLGLFLLTTLLVLGVSVFLVGRQEMRFGSNYRVRSEFDNVAGLSEGADVRVGGIRIGTVQSIQLPKRPDGKVTVTMNLAKETQSIVKQDSVAAIQSSGLLGDKYVEISFGSVDAAGLKGGEKIESEPPLDVADLYHKANQLLDTSQGALENILGATDNLNLITGKINTGHGTLGKLLNDSTLYQQAAAGVSSIHEDADAMKHNFLLRGFFKGRGYTNPAEIKEHAVSQLPTGQPVKSFQSDPKALFDKSDSTKLKNQKALNDAGQYLQSQKFGFAVIAVSTGRTGDADKQRVLSEARAFVIRKYLVENFSLDDSRLSTLGLGKSATANEGGSVEILIYAIAPAAVGKAPAKK
jgi:phospholipid/cholesterol/gamma-HCH transport system substrate-binding protein